MYIIDNNIYDIKKDISTINVSMSDFKIFNVIYQYISPNGIEHADENKWTWHIQHYDSNRFCIVFTNLDDYASITFFNDGRCYLSKSSHEVNITLKHTEEENEKAIEVGYINAAMMQFVQYQQELNFQHILK